MKNLTKNQKDLQKQIIAHVFDQTHINADLRYLKRGQSITLLFTYHDNKASDNIFKLKAEIQDKFKCWFDSGFYTNEPVIEWSLDHSLELDEALS